MQFFKCVVLKGCFFWWCVCEWCTNWKREEREREREREKEGETVTATKTQIYTKWDRQRGSKTNMRRYRHTQMCTFTYSYAYTSAHAYAYTYPYSYICAHVHVHVLSHTRVLLHVRTVHSLSLPLARMHINVRACVNIHAYKCTRISIYTTEYVYLSSIHY